jgi:hypothetical protein
MRGVANLSLIQTPRETCARGCATRKALATGQFLAPNPVRTASFNPLIRHHRRRRYDPRVAQIG